MNKCRIILLAMLIMTSVSCATQYSTDRGSWQRQPVSQPTIKPVIEEAPRPVILPSTTVAPADPVRSLPAAVALRDQATAAHESGDYQRASSLLERALRVSPQDPETFIALAQNNLAMDQPQQATQLARRGLSLNPTSSQRDSLQSIIDQAQAQQ